MESVDTRTNVNHGDCCHALCVEWLSRLPWHVYWLCRERNIHLTLSANHPLLATSASVDAWLDELEARFTRRESSLRAFVPERDRFARLRRDVEELVARFPEPDHRPPLFGVPVGIKDIFHVDGFETRAGSQLPAAVLAGPEAIAVRRLRDAGALILGKTATTEFAYFAPGPTCNPHDAEHTPGGSSSGSAAAVGAGLCSLALGTQTIGSIGRPAAYCGVVGYKPSYDRVARDGVIPLSESLDHVGTFTPDVAGAAQAVAVLISGWRDAPVARRALVLGVPTGRYWDHASDEAKAHFQRCRARLETAGHTIVDQAAWTDFERIRSRHAELVAADAARTHAGWFARFGDRYQAHTSALIRRGAAIDDAALTTLRASRQALRDTITSAMTTAGIDAWITPGAPGTAPHGLDATGDPVLSLPWSQSGLPALTVPAGKGANDLPLGLQVVGRWWGDEDLLAWGTDIAEVVA